jgi:hypothetical protein
MPHVPEVAADAKDNPGISGLLVRVNLGFANNCSSAERQLSVMTGLVDAHQHGH